MKNKTSFNKYNAPELMGQLIAVLANEGLEDAVDQLRSKKVPQIVDKAWRQRNKSASAVASRYLKGSCGGGCGGCGCDGNCTDCQCKAVSDRYLSS